MRIGGTARISPLCRRWKVATASRHHAERFTANGGMLIDRHLDNDELLHLYRRADAIWSCYAPDYNQASGIFGRAVQLGVPAIVRKRSYLQPLAAELEHPVLALRRVDASRKCKTLACLEHPETGHYKPPQ